MIEIRDLCFTYPFSNEPTLKGVNLKIKKGDFVAIIGNNGCGKSTLCKTLNGLIPHFIVGDMSGDILIDGKNIKDYDICELARKIGYVYQDFENQIVCPTVYEDAAFACMNYGIKDYEKLVRNSLKVCGLENKMHDYIWQLSGGQSHLLALAGVYALSPDIIILDEPIAQLDPKHARVIYDILRDLNVRENKTIIVIEHHSDFIGEYCKSVILLKEGQCAWHKESHEALICVKELEECSIHPPQVTVAAKLLQEKGLLDKNLKLPLTIEEGMQIFKQHKGNTIIDEKNQNETVIEIKNVSHRYKSVKDEEINIFTDFSLDINKGDKVCLIGSNGAGKSTLLKLIMGLMKPQQGDVCIHGMNTKEYGIAKLSNSISLVYQNQENMFIHDSIYKDISYAMKERNIENYKEKTDQLLKQFHLNEFKNHDGRLLSGGQMSRAALAIAIALNPSVLLLDEPTANLDIATRHQITHTLENLKDIVDTVIIATHDMQLVSTWANRIIVLKNGQIMKDGTRHDIFHDEIIMKEAGIEPVQIFKMARMLGFEAYSIEEFVERYSEL